jgi:GTPase SAR1 family protein
VFTSYVKSNFVHFVPQAGMLGSYTGMSIVHNVNKELKQINTDILDRLTSTGDIGRIGGNTFKEWQTICRTIQKQLDEEVLRVAVVGAIKSGKSTFVNSLFKADYLKRGAGVVTSIVTKIRRGPYLKASLYFKSWDDVNTEISQALTLFPTHEWESENANFDIRREGDREALDNALKKIHSNLLLVNGVRNANSILIESYLKGFDLVQKTMTTDNFSKIYEDDQFGEQKMFVGSDHLAVYLKDVLLEIRDGDMDKDVEIADCQGSDSPNPRHLAMIQDYLLKTHLLIYVISSRTGLRQADLRFLSIIKNMGILDNILFVINCDFSEHETLEGLLKLVERTREDLSIVTPHVDLFILSSLYNLFKASFKSMSPKEEMRYSQWETETSFIELSDEETRRFQAAFSAKLGEERYSLLLKNNIERLDIVSKSLAHWSDVHREVLTGDADGVASLLNKMTHHQQQMTQIASLVNSTLQGASQKIQQDLKHRIDKFFDARSGSLVKDMLAFIRNFQFNPAPYEDILESTRFTEVLYLVFQDFRAAVDSHLAEIIHPRIVRFIQHEEGEFKSQLESVVTPFTAMVSEAMTEYQASMAQESVSDLEPQDNKPLIVDLMVLKSRNGLGLPPVETTMRYSARIKSEAVLRLGLYSTIKVFRKLIQKTEAQKHTRKRKALADGFRRMKLETERSIRMQFRDYQENIKFQYLFRLTDAIVRQLNDDLLDRFQTYFADTTSMIALVKEDHMDKERLKKDLRDVGETARNIRRRIENLRVQIASAVEPQV